MAAFERASATRVWRLPAMRSWHAYMTPVGCATAACFQLQGAAFASSEAWGAEGGWEPIK